MTCPTIRRIIDRTFIYPPYKGYLHAFTFYSHIQGKSSENANHSISIPYDIYAALLSLHCGYYDTKDTTSQKMAGFLTSTTLYGAIFLPSSSIALRAVPELSFILSLYCSRNLASPSLWKSGQAQIVIRRSTQTLHIFAH